jgi:hypothetical protein
MTTVGTRIRSDSAWLGFSLHSASRIPNAHSVQFYEDDSFLIEDLCRFIGGAILAGDSAVVIATRSHRDALQKRLRSNGLDLTEPMKEARFSGTEGTGER